MAQASKMRNTNATAMNSRSSRSHAVFCLHLHGTNSELNQSLDGMLSLVDLAGSERLAKSGATGDRLKEAQAINKSLSCLADVFLAIGNKQSHIPFRNSKLTYLLKTALSGSGKTLMVRRDNFLRLLYCIVIKYDNNIVSLSDGQFKSIRIFLFGISMFPSLRESSESMHTWSCYQEYSQ